MADKKVFDGIILPTASYADKLQVGAVMGITVRELDHGPQELKFNLAFPRAEGLSRVGIYWLEGTESHGPYSTQACCYWLMPHFSRLSEAGKLAVRVRPTAVEDRTPLKHDVIFWADGKPVAPGHQYAFGVNSLRRVLGDATVEDVIEAWRNEEYELEMSRGIIETRKLTDRVLNDSPNLPMMRAEGEMEIKSRNAGWKHKRPLVADVV